MTRRKGREERDARQKGPLDTTPPSYTQSYNSKDEDLENCNIVVDIYVSLKKEGIKFILIYKNLTLSPLFRHSTLVYLV